MVAAGVALIGLPHRIFFMWEVNCRGEASEEKRSFLSEDSGSPASPLLSRAVGQANGSMIVKVVPSPRALSTDIEPP
jgi:hypothetical protein